MTDGEKILRFAEFKHWADDPENFADGYWRDPDGNFASAEDPDTTDLTWLFRWCVPKLMERGHVGFIKWDGLRTKDQYTVFLNGERWCDTDTPGEALRAAVVSLIDETR